MYITAEQSMILDKAVKSFEVAFRSFIVDSIIKKFPDKDAFAKHILTITPYSDSLIYSQRVRNKLDQLKSNLDSRYSIVNGCYNSFHMRSFDNNVPYVSELLDYVILLFNPCFSQKSILRGFSTVEEFHFNLSVYHRVRNNLSHPASRPIQEQDASRVQFFIRKASLELNDKYFWYISKKDVVSSLDEFSRSQRKSTIKITNLQSTRIQHRRLLCREDELAKLKAYILGGDSIRRLSGSVALYGYGGVGKTALAVDFIQQVIKMSKEEDIGYDFVLFYSSKDEYLQNTATTGDLYIEKVRPEFESFEAFIDLVNHDLGVASIQEASTSFRRGIIVIDNIENIPTKEREAIFKQIRNTPRNIQFIVTSRDEEPCEDKIHIEGFADLDRGRKFIQEYIDSEDLYIKVSGENFDKLLQTSKGNALILVQALTLISEGVVTIDEISSSLYNMRSKNVEVIANFMYKNTFDSVIGELDSKGYNTRDIITIISLYNEPIEIYSISKLTGVDPSISEEVCKRLSQRLVLTKGGEHYQLNEFAKRFVFIKLLPDKYQVEIIKERIKQHKGRIEQKLHDLDAKIANNPNIKGIIEDWQPKNYMERIIIAELFSLYGSAEKACKLGKQEYEKCLEEVNEHEFMSNHPYLSFQKARILKLGLRFYSGKEREEIIKEIERCFEDSIESIEYEYLFIKGTQSHGSILMLFGVFLAEHRHDLKRAVRFLEEGKRILSASAFSKVLFLSYDFLARTLQKICAEGGEPIYRTKLSEVVTELLLMKADGKLGSFSIDQFERKFGKFAIGLDLRK